MFDSLSEAEKSKYIPSWDEGVEIAPNGPFCVFSPVDAKNLDAQLSLYEKALEIIELFKGPEPENPSNGANDGSNTGRSSSSEGSTLTISDQTLLKLAEVMNNRPAPEKDASKMEDANAIAIIKLLFIMGDIDWDTATIIGDLLEPQLSPALLNIFRYKKGSRPAIFKRLIETGMEAPIWIIKTPSYKPSISSIQSREATSSRVTSKRPRLICSPSRS